MGSVWGSVRWLEQTLYQLGSLKPQLMYVQLAYQEHGSEVGIPTDGVALPSWMIQSVQLFEAGSELLRLWVDWDLEEKG